MLRLLEKNISLGAIGVKMISTRPIKNNGLVLVMETKSMSDSLHTAIRDCPEMAEKVVVSAPKSSDKNELVASLSATLDRDAKLKSPCVLIGGDINMRHPLWGPVRKEHRRNDEGVPFVNFIIKHRLNVWKNPDSDATFETRQGKAWIDVTVASEALDYAAHTWEENTGTLSDHNYLEYNLGPENVAERVPRFNLNKFRLKKVAHKIAAINSTLLDQLERSVSPEDLDRFVLALTATIQEVCTTYLELTKQRSNTVPWWDAELETLRNKTSALKRRFTRTLNSVVKSEKKLAYKICRAKFRRTLSTKRDRSWAEFCREVSSLNAYTLLYKICANKVSRPLVIGSIQVDGRPCTSLRDYIEQIVKVLFPSDNEVLTESPEQQARRLFMESYDSANSDQHFTKTEVWSALKQTNRKKAPGLDRIQYEIIVAINNKSPQLFVSLFNRCLDLGHFPRPWKKAKLVLLNKPGKDTTDPRAYRPICLLSTMSKVLDKLVSQRILHQFHSNNLLNPLQHEFLADRSCETTGYDLKEVILDKVEGNLGVCMVSLDVAGAFDDVCWESILYLIGKAACPSNIFRLVRSYLRNRWVCFETQATRVEHEVNRGFSEGSCSGPLFWNIVADSLLDQRFPENSYVQAYADDLVLVIWGHNKSQIEDQGRGNGHLNSLMVTTENIRLISLRRSPSAIKLERDGNKPTIQDIEELQTASQIKSEGKSEIMIKKARRSGL
ncbi:Retrovirus-related Pol polyprotein from type-1 retrotransposable element R1 [Araneus ventricosus]|uniref:Retrovirus-related Pol polyprotein from type-1 retrotransposable element R1 n=1 Tax=Araneus ventricosus TaxID=182803 RepID=A0A4Y2HIG3_ARAVE|nr:Retrovirus-related Pol polyprotein from type-1 retrotransposable element R1 [Araneus ventricosus]